MAKKQILLLPGPTAVPPAVLNAMCAPAIDHRGPEFKELLLEVTEGVKRVFQTKNDLVFLTSSGTGAMEAAVANFLSPGEKVIVLNVGNFGDRFVELCKVYDVETEVFRYEWGTAARPEELAERLAKDKEGEIKAVLVQHNETSTSVMNDIEAISQARGDHPALLIVDAISGLVAADLKTDAWGLDVVLAGSQKAFMIPPGLAGISISPRAWEAAERCKNRKYYFDLKMAKKFLDKGQTPFTPAVSVFMGLRAGLKMIEEEGLEHAFARHRLYRDMVRAGVQALGLGLFTKIEVASTAVTAIKTPEGLSPSEIRAELRDRFNVITAVGQGKWIDNSFRIGHLGYVDPLELLAAMGALEMVLADKGFRVAPGSGVAAAEAVLKNFTG